MLIASLLPGSFALCDWGLRCVTQRLPPCLRFLCVGEPQYLGLEGLDQAIRLHHVACLLPGQALITALSQEEGKHRRKTPLREHADPLQCDLAPSRPPHRHRHHRGATGRRRRRDLPLGGSGAGQLPAVRVAPATGLCLPPKTPLAGCEEGHPTAADCCRWRGRAAPRAGGTPTRRCPRLVAPARPRA